MTEEDRKFIREEIQRAYKKNGNGMTKKIIQGVLIGFIPLAIITGVSSYQGVMQAEKVNQENIKHNKENIQRIDETIGELQKEQYDQWVKIWSLQDSKARGDTIR
jgi:translation initiation factor 2B subunit (eIF-2B alpha/beta/delta family)